MAAESREEKRRRRALAGAVLFALFITFLLAAASLIYSIVWTTQHHDPNGAQDWFVDGVLRVNDVQCEGAPLPESCLPALAGDAVGPAPNNTVEGIQRTPVSPAPPLAGQLMGSNGTAWLPANITSVPGSNILVSNVLETVYVATTQGIAIQTLAVAGDTLLGVNTSCVQPLLPSCYDISGQTCTTPLGASCIPNDAVFNNLLVYNLTAVTSTVLDVSIVNQTALSVENLFVESVYLNGTLSCTAGGSIDNGCLNLGNYSCPMGVPLAESCIPASLVQYDQTVTHTLTVNMVQCVGPPLPSACLPALAGDVTGAPGSNTVVRLQSQPVSATVPTNGQLLAWDATLPGWKPTGSIVYYGTNTQANSGTANTVTIGNGASTLGTTRATAVGAPASATGLRSTALGHLTQASGVGALAAGEVAISLGGGGVALGSNSFTSANVRPTAVGPFALATGDQASAFGSSANASAFLNTALGYGTHTTLRWSTAVGAVAEASAEAATAVGVGAHATAQEAAAFGVNCVADALFATVMGRSSDANGIQGSVTLGNLASPTDAAHGFALGIPSASVTPATLGITLNGASRSIRTYASLFASTAGAGPTVLTATSAHIQVFTTAQTVTLPAVFTLEHGFTFRIINRSGGSVVVQSSGAITVITLVTLTAADLVFVNIAGGSSAASWSALGPVTAT